MKLSQSSLALLEDTLKKAIGKYTCGCEQTIVTDIHLQPNQNSGELSIFDDEDEELANTSIEEWMTYEGDDFYENVERILSSLLCNMKNEGKFDKLTILKPFSFVLVDDVIKSQGYLNPYILEERQLNVTQLDVFSRLMMDRIIFLGTQIDDYTANTLQAQLLYLDSVESGKDISIYINSPGGSVYAGLGIYDTMQFINSDVATICTGMAASMAAVLLVAGTEGKRSALTHSRVMIHQPMGGAQGQASDIEITAREIQKLKKELYTIIADHSHTDFDKVWADSDRDYWMTAQEAKEYGMIDEVLSRKPAAL